MPRKQNSQVDKKLTTYPVQTGQRPYRQVADFLLWAKVSLPGLSFDHEQITRAVKGYLPNSRVTVAEVAVVKNAMHRAKLLLLDGIPDPDGSRRKGVLLADRGLGYRCAVDDDEATDKGLRRGFERVNSSKSALANIAEAINQNGIVESHNKRFYRAVTTSPNFLPSSEDDRIARLLPEKKPEKKP